MSSAAEQARSIKKLTHEKERYAAEASEAAERYAQALDAVKEREISVLQLQKKIAETANGIRIRDKESAAKIG